MANNKPVVITHFGRPHSGKTYLMERFANSSGRETIFVYNAGRKEDWQGYEVIKLRAERKTETLFFTYKNKEYEFAKSFMKLFKGKRVRARRGRDRMIKNLLFLEMTEEGYEGTFFIIDDAVGIIGSKLTFEMSSLFFGSKHVDIWLGVVFHDPNQFPVGAWSSLTSARFFVNNVEPPVDKAKKIPHFPKVMSAFRTLKNAPLYSYCTIDMNTGEAKYIKYKDPAKAKPRKKTKSKTKKK